MDSHPNTLLELIPKEVSNSLVDDELGYIITGPMFTEEEIKWLFAIRRTFMIMASTETECDVQYYSISPECKMKDLQPHEEPVSMDSYVMCRKDDKINVQLDGPQEAFRTSIIEYLTDEESYMLYVDDITDQDIYSTSVLLDLRSIFLIYQRRLKLAQFSKPREFARKRTAFVLREIHKRFSENLHLYRMYLSSNILSMEIEHKINYKDMSPETTKQLCDEYCAILEQEIAEMR